MRGKNAGRRSDSEQHNVIRSPGFGRYQPVEHAPRSVAVAHAQHTPLESTAPPPSPTPTLGDRFHALPAELRQRIFSLRLVQPPKWDMPHEPSCPPLKQPGQDIIPRMQPANWRYRYSYPDTCIRCRLGHHHQRVPLWQRHDPPLVTWTNPWRSQWAPPVTNPFVCADCWDECLRLDPHPQALEAQRDGRLPGLCARRQNLQTLLVCRAWYEEAGLILYTTNTFAFEHPRMLIGFIQNLPPHRRRQTTRISLQTPYPASHDTLLLPSLPSKLLYTTLRTLPCLTHLELPALYLTSPKVTHSLLRLGLRRLRHMRFTLPNHSSRLWDAWTNMSPYFLPRYARSRILIGGLAEEVARATKGQRRKWLKRPGAVNVAVKNERMFLQKLLAEAEETEKHGALRRGAVRDRIWYAEDVGVWEWIWREGGGEAVWAYLPDKG